MNPRDALSELDGSRDASPVTGVTGAMGVRPPVVLRGTARGLDLVVRGEAPVAEIARALTVRLEEAPGFFRGSDVRIRVEDGPLAAGCLARIDEIACRFELRIVEVGALRREPEPDAVPKPSLAAGTAPVVAEAASEDAEETAAVAAAEPAAESAAAPAPEVEPEARTEAIADVAELAVEDDPRLEGARVVVGPVRSGVILEHPGHLLVFGDVNPGAEVRAEGNIVVLGRLRGIAHAGIGRELGFIVALRLEPQQLRICRTVARAGDSDKASAEPEIAHVTDNVMIVERYRGRLPASLAASI